MSAGAVSRKRTKSGKRIFSTADSLLARRRATKPRFEFKGHNLEDFRRWQREFFKIIKGCLGPLPKAVPLRAEVLERKVFHTYIREKVVFDSERFMSVPAWVCSPLARKKGEKFPGVLCCHGHGPGKNPLVGLDNEGRPLKEYHKEISVRLAENGYVTITPDWRVFGERAEPPGRNGAPRDICNLASMAVEYFGFTLLNLNIWDGMKAIDYLISRNDVLPKRIGCVGVSFGGTMTTYISAMDNRVRSACISGYLNCTADGLLGGYWNTCGSQYLPGLLKYGDVADVAGLICPRPLLVQIGEYDSVFPAQRALKAYEHVNKIYKAAGATERLALDLFDGVHEFNIPPIIKFLSQRLKEE